MKWEEKASRRECENSSDGIVERQGVRAGCRRRRKGDCSDLVSLKVEFRVARRGSKGINGNGVNLNFSGGAGGRVRDSRDGGGVQQ